MDTESARPDGASPPEPLPIRRAARLWRTLLAPSALAQAARRLARDRRFTLTAAATLGLCLGVNLTVFAVVDGMLLRPLPFPAAGRLVTIFNTYPRAHVLRDESSITNYYERRGRIPAFTSLAIYHADRAVVGDDGSTRLEPVMRVSPEFFETLGVGPAIGRGFTEAETAFGADRVAVVTDALWRQSFEADPHVVGRTIRLDGERRTIVGVLPPGFEFLSSRARIYVPFATRPQDRVAAGRHWGSAATMIARLAPGVSLAQAQAQIDAHNARMAAEAPAPDEADMARAGFRSLVVSLQADHVAAVRPVLLLVQAGVLVLLVIGTVNLLGLWLVRASARERELAVRQALGAGRVHVVREVLAETLLVAACGGGLALAIGAAGIRAFAAFGGTSLPLGTRVAFDVRAAIVTLAGALAVGIAIGVPLAWFSLRHRLALVLRATSRGSTAGRGVQRMRHAFVVAQVALAFVLLSAASLLGLSLQRAMAVSPGFQADHVLTGRVPLPGSRYGSRAARLAFVERLDDVLAREPGVLSAGVVTNVPMSGHDTKSAATVARPAGAAPPPHGIYSYGVGGDYFAVMHVPLLEGRLLRPDDSRRDARVCVVDQDFADYQWPGQRAIGRRLFQGGQAGPDREAFTVVGVVAPVKQAGLTDRTAQGAVYYPYGYFAQNPVFVVARTGLPPESLATVLQRAVRTIDPELPVDDVESMDGRIDDSLLARRSSAAMLTIFAGLALLLTALGTYGVLSYAVAERRREIGVRMALGARPGQVRRQFLAVGARLLVAGVGIGVAGAWVVGHAMQAVLFDVPPLDPTALAVTTGLMTIVILAGCLLPSRRAAHTSPVDALHE